MKRCETAHGAELHEGASEPDAGARQRCETAHGAERHEGDHEETIFHSLVTVKKHPCVQSRKQEMQSLLKRKTGNHKKATCK